MQKDYTRYLVNDTKSMVNKLGEDIANDVNVIEKHQ